MKADPKALADEAREFLRERLQRYVADDNATREDIQAAVASHLNIVGAGYAKYLKYGFGWLRYGVEDTDGPNRMRWNDNSQLRILPGNLFTALILTCVPLDLAAKYVGIEEGHMEWRGCTIAYRNNQMTITPDQPAEVIEIDFTPKLED